MSSGMGLLFAIVGAHVVLVALIFVALARGARAAPAAENGRRMIRPSRALLWSAVLLSVWAAVGVGLVAEALIRAGGRTGGLIAGLPLALVAGLVAAFALARYARHRIVWDGEALEVRDWRGASRSHAWRDLAAATEKTRGTDHGLPASGPARLGMRQLELRFSDGAVVRAAPNMAGYLAFVADARAAAERLGIAWRGAA